MGFTWMGPKCYYKCPCKTKADVDLTTDSREYDTTVKKERSEDASLLALKIEEGAMIHRMQEVQLWRLEEDSS